MSTEDCIFRFVLLGEYELEIAAVSGGNDLHMTVVYCALAGSAGWWTLKIYKAGGVTETLNLNCLGCCVRLGGATNLRVAVPLLSLRVR